jgi:hypothetical protein
MLVCVPHEVASFSQISVRLGVHPDARVQSVLPVSTTIFARYVRNVFPPSVYYYAWPHSEPEVHPDGEAEIGGERFIRYRLRALPSSSLKESSANLYNPRHD